ncbi:MAG: hypothetical protein BWY25_02807 [Chloroflexi bacterium ADurb.Bin222]|nr:MAG: hypothetical protein BWY25_02807 [Chloroflexi bacterium ADurb.Bin222]
MQAPVAKGRVRSRRTKIERIGQQVVLDLIAHEAGIGLPDQSRHARDVRRRSGGAIEGRFPIRRAGDARRCSDVGFEPPVRRRPLRAVIRERIIPPVGRSHRERADRVAGGTDAVGDGRQVHFCSAAMDEDVKRHGGRHAVGLHDSIHGLTISLYPQGLRRALSGLAGLRLLGGRQHVALRAHHQQFQILRRAVPRILPDEINLNLIHAVNGHHLIAGRELVVAVAVLVGENGAMMDERLVAGGIHPQDALGGGLLH